MDVVHGCSGVTFPSLMKEDLFSLRILHENSFYGCYSTSSLYDMRFFAFFPGV